MLDATKPYTEEKRRKQLWQLYGVGVGLTILVAWLFGSLIDIKDYVLSPVWNAWPFVLAPVVMALLIQGVDHFLRSKPRALSFKVLVLMTTALLQLLSLIVLVYELFYDLM